MSRRKREERQRATHDGRGQGRALRLRAGRALLSTRRNQSSGVTLVELVITVTVLTVLTLGVIPLVKTSVRRQREYRLRESLREMREAIDAFKHDTVGIQCGGAGGLTGGVPTGVPTGVPNGNNQPYIDPRSKVVISDCTIFGVENIDHYPPDLETLVSGVNVVPRNAGNQLIPGRGLGEGTGQATDNKLLSTKKKVYLREIPIDPITGEKDWCIRSSFDPPSEGCSSSPVNVFDVRSKATGTALNGEKYSDW